MKSARSPGVCQKQHAAMVNMNFLRVVSEVFQIRHISVTNHGSCNFLLTCLLVRREKKKKQKQVLLKSYISPLFALLHMTYLPDLSVKLIEKKFIHLV